MNWFTSDEHFNHSNIIKYCNRPFSSLEEMNEALIQKWNERVDDADTVYVVGDMFLGRPEDATPLIKRLKGRKVLIRGNHDRSHRTMLECGFDETWQRKELLLQDGRRAVLNHKPLPNSVIGACDLQIHGHRHSLPIVDGRRINVCVDLWGYAPISEDELCSVELGEPESDEVHTALVGDMVEVKALVRKEDMEGLLDHLYVFSRTIWDTAKKE